MTIVVPVIKTKNWKIKALELNPTVGKIGFRTKDLQVISREILDDHQTIVVDECVSEITIEKGFKRNVQNGSGQDAKLGRSRVPCNQSVVLTMPVGWILRLNGLKRP